MNDELAEKRVFSYGRGEPDDVLERYRRLVAAVMEFTSELHADVWADTFFADFRDGQITPGESAEEDEDGLKASLEYLSTVSHTIVREPELGSSPSGRRRGL